MKFKKNEWIILIASMITFGGIFGFIYEFIFYFINGGCKEFYYRGGDFLPWIDVYALGSLVIFFLTYKIRKKPFIVFLVSALSCGIIEYLAGYLIYIFRDGARFWNYNTEILNFGNINGFICLRSILFFGISGLFLIYVMIPFIIKMFNNKLYCKLIIIVTSIILIDYSYNLIALFTSLPAAHDIYEGLGVNYVKFD